MDRQTERQTDKQTDELHKLHVYVGLAQACPNKWSIVNCSIITLAFYNYLLDTDLIDKQGLQATM